MKPAQRAFETAPPPMDSVQDPYFAVIGPRWTEACSALCVDALGSAGADEATGFCTHWQTTYSRWSLFTPTPNPGAGVFDDFRQVHPAPPTLSYSTLALPPPEPGSSPQAEHRQLVLARLIDFSGHAFIDADRCIADLPPQGRDVRLTFHFDASGSLVEVESPETDPTLLGCLQGYLAEVGLPPRVARDYPQLDVIAHVRPLPRGGPGSTSDTAD